MIHYYDYFTKENYNALAGSKWYTANNETSVCCSHSQFLFCTENQMSIRIHTECIFIVEYEKDSKIIKLRTLSMTNTPSTIQTLAIVDYDRIIEPEYHFQQSTLADLPELEQMKILVKMFIFAKNKFNEMINQEG